MKTTSRIFNVIAGLGILAMTKDACPVLWHARLYLEAAVFVVFMAGAVLDCIGSFIRGTWSLL